MGTLKGRIRHKYNIVTDICEICGVRKRKKMYVGSGYNPGVIGRYDREYSRDGIHWQKEYINCLPKPK